MRDVTRHTLNQIVNCDLFGRVGEPVDDDRIVQVATWKDAIKAHESVYWQHWILEERNRLTMALHKHARARYSATFGKVTDECEGIVREVVSKSLARFSSVPGIDTVKTNAEWNVLGGLMEAEYSDIVPTGFFTEALHWHFQGHYPCSRDDTFPKGRFLIY
jgi:hypothetical protein